MKITKYFFAVILVVTTLISCTSTDTDEDLELIQTINKSQSDGGEEGNDPPPPPPPIGG